MHNILVFVIQVFSVTFACIWLVRLGERALNAWLCVVAVAMNLFVTKQVSIAGFDVTASEGLTVSYMLGLCLLQEYFGKRSARMHVVFSLLCSGGFVGISLIHLCYHPNVYDDMHPLFVTLLSPMPRLILASLTSFAAIQILDIAIFQKLRTKWQGRYLSLRSVVCVTTSQLADTLIFSFLGLYGVVENLFSLMVFSTMVKLLAILGGGAILGMSKYINKTSSLHVLRS